MWRKWFVCLFALGLILCVAQEVRAAAPTFTTIDFPGACGTIATAINYSGTIVGDFGFSCKTPEVVHGYTLSQGAFTQFDFPGATSTRPLGISDAGDIVGWFRDSKQGKDHGFLLSGGAFTSIDFPGASQTHATGIDPAGEIFGGYCIGGNACYAPSEGVHGFVLSGLPGGLGTGSSRADRGKVPRRKRRLPYISAEQRQLYHDRFPGSGRNRAELARDWWDQCGRRHRERLLCRGTLQSVADSAQFSPEEWSVHLLRSPEIRLRARPPASTPSMK